MHETSKAVMRRVHDSRFVTRYFVGAGIDIGAGKDQLGQYHELFPGMRSCRAWDLPDGDEKIVRRMLKEIEQGKGPSLSEAEDGTVTGVFDDGVTTRLVPGKPLKDNPCSCPAVGVCRHRVGVALAYRGWAQAQAAPAACTTARPLSAVAASAWPTAPLGW